MKGSERNFCKKRLILIYIVFAILFAALSVRMCFVIIQNPDKKNQEFLVIKNNKKRANIYDRNGVILATDIETKSLYLRKILTKNPEETKKKLQKIFPKIEKKFAKIFKQKTKQKWFLLKRNLTPNQEIKVKNLQLAELILKKDISRIYPHNPILSHILGYTNIDKNGISGIEMQYNQELKNNQSITLAIDVRIQSVLYYELQKAFNKYHAIGAAGIIIDANNGEIISIASLPSFSLNNIKNASNKAKFNRATYGVYELGSILKIITNAIAIEKKLININDKFSVKDPIKYGRFTINDYHKYDEDLTVTEIFAKSSNIGTVKIAKLMSPQLQKEYFEKLNLTKKLSFDFPSLGYPIFPKRWGKINLYTMSYGHGIAITPLHLTSAVSAVVNGGILYNPSLLKLMKKPKGEVIFKERTSELVNKMMRQTILNGTGKNAAVKDIAIGGKTGTAEKPENGKYNKNKTITSFLATVPAKKPKYIILIAIDEPKTKFKTGGITAAPVARIILEKISSILVLN
ncbi:penicillin-binding protein 2 [Flavobacteriaceae bacterium]|nr:penicillin-binding protein 2 [Flavobacteriaceae bacterium]